MMPVKSKVVRGRTVSVAVAELVGSRVSEGAGVAVFVGFGVSEGNGVFVIVGSCVNVGEASRVEIAVGRFEA
jgi:hypothetical protein